MKAKHYIELGESFGNKRIPVRQYDPGHAPCSNCQKYSHGKCRPRIDGTICSCSCPDAEDFRQEYTLHVSLAMERGEPIPTVADIAKKLFPRWKQHFFEEKKCG